MNASKIRGIVGMAALTLAGAGMAMYSVPLALTVCGLVVFVICVWGEIR